RVVPGPGRRGQAASRRHCVFVPFCRPRWLVRFRSGPAQRKGLSQMASSAHGTSRLAYPGTLAMLVLALLFPIALMVFNPTLMFERGWEQYVGPAIYAWAVLTLARELGWLWKNERAFDDASAFLKHVTAG